MRRSKRSLMSETKAKKAIQKVLTTSKNVETVVDSNVIGGVQKFDSDRDMKVQITAMTKTEADEFNEMMNRRIARWDKCKNLENAELRSETFMEIANSELEDNATFSDDGFSDDNSFFHCDDENKFHCMDDNLFLPNICEWLSNSESFETTIKNEFTVERVL